MASPRLFFRIINHLHACIVFSNRTENEAEWGEAEELDLDFGGYKG